MKRRLMGTIAVLCLLLSATANAVQMRSLRPTLSLSFSGTTANCSATVTDAGKELDHSSGNRGVSGQWSAAGIPCD